jgi:hypothetical protein
MKTTVIRKPPKPLNLKTLSTYFNADLTNNRTKVAHKNEVRSQSGPSYRINRYEFFSHNLKTTVIRKRLFLTQLENTIYLNADLTDNRIKVAHKNKVKVGQVVGLIGISFSRSAYYRVP